MSGGARDGEVAEVVAVMLGAREGENVTLGGWVTLVVVVVDIGGVEVPWRRIGICKDAERDGATATGSFSCSASQYFIM